MGEKMTQLVMGCIDNYSWDDVAPWVISLRRVYSGDVTLLCWPNTDPNLIQKLQIPPYNIQVVKVGYKQDTKGHKMHIAQHRFLAMYEYLRDNIKYDEIVTTDVKDVIFQTEVPFSGVDINCAFTAEHFTYNQEPWSKANMLDSFGSDALDLVRDLRVICAGIIVGHRYTIIPLFLNIFLLSQSSITGSHSPGGGAPDQSALNIILTQFYHLIRDNNIHLGTTATAISLGGGEIGQRYIKGTLDYDMLDIVERMLVYEKTNFILNNGILSWKDKTYNIVHQWDRIPQLAKIIRETYKE